LVENDDFLIQVKVSKKEKPRSEVTTGAYPSLPAPNGIFRKLLFRPFLFVSK
jgi:hypothetical protein